MKECVSEKHVERTRERWMNETESEGEQRENRQKGCSDKNSN